MKWIVTNALSRDVERQQLNKILAEIRATCEDLAQKTDTSSNSVDMDALAQAVTGNVEEGINVTYDNVNKTLDFVVNNFTIRLAGDVTGTGEVVGLSSITIDTTIDPSKVGIGDAPIDNQTYWRKNAEWEAVPDDLFSFLELEGEGFPALHSVDLFPTWDLRTYQGPDSVKIINGDGAAGDPSWSLDNDEASPAGMKSYSTDNVGVRGWHYPSLFESTGMLSNGGVDVLSINGADNTKFDVAAALYGVVDYTSNAAQPARDVKVIGPFLAQTVTNLLTSPETYVGMQVSTSTIIQQATNFTNSQRRTIVPLGVLVHTNLTNINAVNNLPSIVRGGINQLLDWINYSGRRHRDTAYGANGVNLNVNRLAGDVWVSGGNFTADQNDPNVIPIPAQTALTFRYRHRFGEVVVDRTTIDPANYNPTGSTISAVPANDWTVQRLFVFPSGLNRFQYGQVSYPKLEDAIAGFQAESFITEGNLARNGTFLGWLVVKQNATDLSNPAQARFITASNDGQPAAASAVLTTTDSLPEGTSNRYFTQLRVLTTPLTGLSLASAVAITSADTVLSAAGKLQAQITANGTTLSGLVIDSIADADTTHAPSRNAVFDALADKVSFPGLSTLVTTPTYTAVLGDEGKIIRCNSVSPQAVTIPDNASVPFPIGARLSIMQNNTGATTVVAGAGVTLRGIGGGAVNPTAQYGVVTYQKYLTDAWIVISST